MSRRRRPAQARTKSLAKAAVRPLTRRLLFWTDRHIEAAVTPLYESAARGEQRFAAHDAELTALRQRLEALEPARAGLEAALPQVLEALSTQNAWARRGERRLAEVEGLAAVAADAQERVGQVESRLEFIRRELAFEMRYAASNGRQEPAAPVVARVLNPEKISAQGDKVRVNLGCGHLPLEDYVNVDMRELPGVDVVADVHDLPFAPGGLVEVHSEHTLEHFPVEDLRRTLLPSFNRLLCDTGVLSAVVPDAETMIAEYAAGRYSFEDLRLVTFGEQEYQGDFHFTMFSQEELTSLLHEAGFVDITFPVVGRRNGACYEMQVQARKAAGTAGLA